MDLTQLILTGLPAGTWERLARQAGVDEATAQKVVGASAPALGEALGGPRAPQALSSGLGDLPATPEGLTSPAAGQAGAGLLERLLGGQGLEALAGQVAVKTGVSPAVVQRILPYAATLLAHALGKTGGGPGGVLGGLAGSAPGGILGKLFKG